MAGKKLLVADDSLTIQKVIRLALSNEGYEIQAVSDGNDAVQQISLFRPDIILIDVSLPGKTAFVVKREVNQHEDLAEVRFVLMSSAFEKVDEVQASEVQFHGRLTKPFDPAHLRQVLIDALSQVAAKRAEPTKQIHRPVLPPVAAVPPPLPSTRFGGPNKPPEAPKAPTPPPIPSSDDLESVPQILDLSAHLTPPPAPDAPLPEAVHPPMAPSNHGPDYDDIKHLTESTIKMSGLVEDFQWSVNEPSLKPPSKVMEDAGSSFELDLRDDIEKETGSPPPPIPAFTPPPAPPTPVQAKSAVPVPVVAPAPAPSLSKDEMAEVLRSEIRKLIPEIAERVLKDEIHRMLSEKP